MVSIKFDRAKMLPQQLQISALEPTKSNNTNLNLITSKFDTKYANANQDLRQFLFAIEHTRADIIGAPRCTRLHHY